MNVLALCAGVGGMEIGLSIATRGAARAVCYVEREAYAAAILVARMADKALDQAPVWDDLATFDGRPWCGVVDLITSGLPCQPYSVAGKGLGHEDERALWPHFVRIVEECEPRAVFLENVPAFRKHFEPVWRRLRQLGFEWAPPLLQTASESGAPHIRERFFAFAARPEREGLEGWSLPGCERPDERAAGTVCSPASHTHSGGREGEWCGWVFDRERQTLRHDPDGLGCGCRIAGSDWEAESPILRVDDGPAHRVDELRAVGNIGAPPVAYAEAWRILTNANR